jgi:hypothetical protein
MGKKRAKKTQDADLDVWVRLSSGMPEDELKLTEGERIVVEGNEFVRGWLAATQRPKMPAAKCNNGRKMAYTGVGAI